MSNIRITYSLIKDIVHIPTDVERPQQVKLRRQAIHQYRNQLLEQAFNLPIDAESIVRTEQGKPILKDHPKYQFNHSHSQSHYALATSQQLKDLGVDIEDINRKVRFEELARHAFHPEEFSMWQSLEEDPIYWFKVWTTKEAILKASGLGIRMNLKDLNTRVHPLQDGGMVEHENLGIFGYRNIHLAEAIVTVAWRSEQSCKGFNFPQIELQQH